MGFLPATRTTALSAGSSTESWLFRLRLSCLDRFHGSVSPFGPVVLWGHGDRDPPERSLRNERSLTHERSLRLSSSEEDMSQWDWKRAWRVLVKTSAQCEKLTQKDSLGSTKLFALSVNYRVSAARLFHLVTETIIGRGGLGDFQWLKKWWWWEKGKGRLITLIN